VAKLTGVPREHRQVPAATRTAADGLLAQARLSELAPTERRGVLLPLIPRLYSGASSTRTARGSSSGSRPSSQAAESQRTNTFGTSSRTTRPTPTASSASTAVCSESDGRGRASRTSRSPVDRRSTVGRAWTGSSAGRGDAGGGTRTHTLFRAPGPKPGLSASSSTPAERLATASATVARDRSRS
jgi:hypothetical protein